MVTTKMHVSARWAAKRFTPIAGGIFRKRRDGAKPLRPQQGFTRQVDALRVVFKGRVLALEPIEGGNAIAFAWVGEWPVLDAQSLQARNGLRSEMGINFSGTVARVVRAVG